MHTHSSPSPYYPLPFEARAAELYKCLYIARSVAEHIRDGDKEDRDNLRRFYNSYRAWEYTAAALSSGYSATDRIIAMSGAYDAARFLAGDRQETLDMFTCRNNGTTNDNSRALPCGAVLRRCGTDADALLAQAQAMHMDTDGTVFFLLDVDEHNAEAASLLLEHAIRSRIPLMMAVSLHVPARIPMSYLKRTISRHGGAHIHASSYSCPRTMLDHVYRLNTYVRAEYMQGLITFQHETHTAYPGLSHERKASEDLLGYLSRIVPDHTRRAIIYNAYTSIADGADDCAQQHAFMRQDMQVTRKYHV